MSLICCPLVRSLISNHGIGPNILVRTPPIGLGEKSKLLTLKVRVKILVMSGDSLGGLGVGRQNTYRGEDFPTLH